MADEALADILGPEPEPLLIKPPDAWKLLSIGERKLWSLTNCGAIPSRQVGRSRRYCPAELRAWVQAGCPTAPGSGERIKKAVRQ